MSEFIFPKRMIHLDFHTSEAITDVGAEFDPDEFAETFREARVDSVTVFAKCHHGMLYYDTDRPERHPGLSRTLDLMGEQIEALHRKGIRAPVYISGPVDMYAGKEHPEWRPIDPATGVPVGAKPLDAGWLVMDMSSPYQDYLADQIDEVLRKYSPLDGLFIDMCWDQVSVSRWAMDGMKKKGLDPCSDDDRKRYARLVTYEYMARYRDMFEDSLKGHPPAGIWFNSRPKVNLHEEKKYLRHVEIESLPTGGWGYAYFPYVARYVRPFNMPTLSHTGRFNRSWGDFGGLKPEAALKYECCLILSQGMTSGIGDQLHPRGRADKAVYDEISRVYSYIEQCEPLQEGGEVVSEIAVLVDPELGDDPGPCGLGLIRALQQLRYQFDLLQPGADIAEYELVIIPETTPVDSGLVSLLKEYLKNGGKVLISGRAALNADDVPIMEELGIVSKGDSPFTATYLRPEETVADGVPVMDHVCHEQGFRMNAGDGAEVLCRVIEPYFERTYEHFCSHAQTPPDALTEYAAAVQNGSCITFSMPVFTEYGRHGSLPVRTLLGNCIARLLPEPLLRDDGPAHLETTVMRCGDRTVVHLISYCPVRRTEDLDIVENPTPIVGLNLSVKLDREPDRVLLAPEGKELEFRYENGYAQVSVSVLEGHGMIVFE